MKMMISLKHAKKNHPSDIKSHGSDGRHEPPIAEYAHGALIFIALLLYICRLRLRVALWQVRIHGLIIRYTLFEVWYLVQHRVNHVGDFYVLCAHNDLVGAKRPNGDLLGG